MTKEKFFRLEANKRPLKALEIAKKLPLIDDVSAPNLVSRLQELDAARGDKTVEITDNEVLQAYKDVTNVDLPAVDKEKLAKDTNSLQNIIAEHRDLFYQAVLITDDNIEPIKALGENASFRSSGAGYSGFEKAIVFYNNPNTEVYFVYASPTPYEGKGFYNIHMYFSATTSVDADFESHMGIERVGRTISKRDIASELHEFGAKVMKAVNPIASYMITSPTKEMRHMLQKWFDEKGRSEDFTINTHQIEKRAQELKSLKGAIDDYKAYKADQKNPGWEAHYKSWVVAEASAYVRSHEQNLESLIFYNQGFGKDEKDGQLTLPDGSNVIITEHDKTTKYKWYFEHNYHTNVADPKVLVVLNSLATLSGDERAPEFFTLEEGEIMLHPMEDASIYSNTPLSGESHE